MKEELIQKFFRKECTAEEASEVTEFLKNNPQILDDYVSKKEWDEIESNVLMPEKFWEEVWETIQKKERAHVKVLWIKRSAVAACIVGLIVLGFFRMEEKKVNVQLSTLPMKENVAPAVQNKIVINTSVKKEQILLPDSSVVELSKGAIIKYVVPFINNKRDIELEGEAYFKVAKDKTKPFTVYAGGLATTAVGTEFRITTSSSTGKIIVQLYKGKVLIRRMNKSMKGGNEDVYLSPGEELKFDTTTTLVAVEKIKTMEEDLPVKQKTKTNKNNSAATNGLAFSSSSLPDVMDQLSKYFNAKILYNKSEMESMNFTGMISKSDSLSIILKVIAQMNNLQVSSTDSGFLVERINNEFKKGAQ